MAAARMEVAQARRFDFVIVNSLFEMELFDLKAIVYALAEIDVEGGRQRPNRFAGRIERRQRQRGQHVDRLHRRITGADHAVVARERLRQSDIGRSEICGSRAAGWPPLDLRSRSVSSAL